MTSAITINQLLNSMPAPSFNAMFDGPAELSLEELAMIHGGSFTGGEVAATVMAGAGLLIGAGAALLAAPVAAVGAGGAILGSFLIGGGLGLGGTTVYHVATHQS